jgi:Protein kinase domain
MSGDAAPKKDPFGLAGGLLDARFRIEREVAEGGFGVVYYATQIALDRPVAIKVLKTPAGFDEAAKVEFRDRFASEGKTIARIRHPHIVDVYDFGVSQMPSGEIAPWMALEWLQGETLEDQLLRRRGRGGQTPAEVLATLRPVLQAFAFAHKQGIAHRDIKPANIMAVPSEHGVTMRVLDFGIAKVVSPDEAAGSGRTKTSGIPAFSPLYASPEQIAFGRTGPWTDVHALGLIFTEFLTDQPPYLAEDVQIFEQIIAAERPTPRAKGVDVGAWEPVLRKALALSPSERWRSAGDLLAALEANVGKPEDGAVVSANVRDVSSAANAARGAEASAAPARRPTAEPGLPALESPGRRRAGTAWGIAIGIAVALGGVGAVVVLRAPREAKPADVTAQPPGPTPVPHPTVALSPTPAPATTTPPAAPVASAPTATTPARTEVTAPAAPDPEAAAREAVRIEIRTEPPTAKLLVDHREVRNPYVVKAPRSHHLHDVVATLAGSADVHEVIAFDRDRDLALKLGPTTKHPAASVAPASAPSTPRPETAEPSAGYHGSKLKIETQFP